VCSSDLQAVHFSEVLSTYGSYLVFPGLFFLATFALLIGSLFTDYSGVTIALLLSWSLMAFFCLFMNGWSLVVLKFRSNLFIPALCFELFTPLFAGLFSLFAFGKSQPLASLKDKAKFILFFCLSLSGINLYPIHFFLRGEQPEEKRHPWNLTNWNLLQWTVNSIFFYFLCLPMSVVELFSFHENPSPILVVSIGFNVAFSIIFVAGSVLGMSLERKPKKDIVLLSDYARDEGEERDENGEEENQLGKNLKQAFYARIILLLIAPFFFISILGQVLSVLGIPYCLRSLKRFFSPLLNRQDEETEGKTLPKEALTLVEARGLFLLPISLLFFCLLMLFLLPLLSLAAVIFWFADLGATRREGISFPDFKTSCQIVISHLFYCYFPFLDSSPPVEVRQEEEEPPKWKLFVALGWFLTFEFGLVLFDIVSDVLFSLRLFSLWKDPLLGQREDLFRWLVLSFVATSCGIFFWILFFLVEMVKLRKKHVGLRHWKRYFLNHSPFGYIDSGSLILIKGMNTLCEDVLQLVVSINSLTFVGTITGIWGLKLSISLASSCFSLSKTLTSLLFGKDSNKILRFWTQLCWFAFSGALLSTLVSLTLGSDFCTLTRSVRDPSILGVLSQCPVLPQTIRVSALKESASFPFKTNQLAGAFEIEDCHANQFELDFENLLELEGNLSIFSNTASVGIGFARLSTMKEGSSVFISNNPNFRFFSALLLSEISSNSSLAVRDSSLTDPLAFPSLTRLEGNMLLSSSHVDSLTLLTLSLLLGSLSVEHSMVEQINLPSLSFNWGRITLSQNSKLQTLTFPSLTSSREGEVLRGELLVESNPSLLNVSFPSAQDISFVIRNNSLLQGIAFGSSLSLSSSLISDSSSIQFLDLRKVREIKEQLVISQNTNLKEIDMSGWECDGTLFLSDNPDLEVLKISFSRCALKLRLRNNPKLSLTFVS